MKLWIVDRIHIYLGSANMDWKSLSQVKELGVVVMENADIGIDASNLFESWWQWTNLNTSPYYNSKYFANKFVVKTWSPDLQTNLNLPCWSDAELIPDDIKCNSPVLKNIIIDSTSFDLSVPPSSLFSQFNTSLNSSYASYFISSSPPEITPQVWKEPISVSISKSTADNHNISSRKWMSGVFFKLPEKVPGLFLSLLSLYIYIYISLSLSLLTQSYIYTQTHSL